MAPAGAGPGADYDDPAEASWQTQRRVPHPARCFTEPVRLRSPLERWPFGLTYVKTTAAGATLQAVTLSGTPPIMPRRPTVGYHEIQTNHVVASNEPAGLIAILLTLA